MKSQFREFLFGAKHLTGLLVAAATVAVLLFMEVGAVGQDVGAVKHSVSALPSTLRRRDITRRPQQKLSWEGCCSGTRFCRDPKT